MFHCFVYIGLDMTATCTSCPNGQTRCTAPPQKYDKKAIISHLTRKNAIKILPLSIYCLPLHTLKRQCSGFSAVGSAHVWGARGRWFESSNPDITKGVAAARFATPFCFCSYLMSIAPALGGSAEDSWRQNRSRRMPNGHVRWCE